MASLLFQTIEQISREKHIEPEIIVSAIEDAMVVAARKYYKTEDDLRARFNPETGQVDVFAVRAVVEEVTDPNREWTLAEAKRQDPNAQVGTEIVMSRPTDVLGRTGELVNCIVKRTEGPDIIVDMGRTEARMPKREQSRLETYTIGERLRVVIRAVDRAAKGPQVIVSRADPVLVQRLFEMEVPEIYDGTVQIRAVAREAGERTKIAVQSRDKDVDPVGACVGMKGMRVQSIIRELRGEKIDIIPYSEETVAFAQKALSPAKVTRVQIVDPESKSLEIIVEDTQLSLAIGKKGQNVRLASKLIGWNIDIKSEEEKRQELEAQMTALTAPGTSLDQLAGVGPKTIEKIQSAGINSIEKLADMTPEKLMEIPGIGEKMVEKIYQSVRTYFENLEAQQGAAAAEGAEPAAGEPVPGIEDAEGELAPQQESAAEAQAVEPAAASETAVPAKDAAVVPAGGEESQPDKESEKESEGETS
jgi:N utilization substance protein A